MDGAGDCGEGMPDVTTDINNLIVTLKASVSPMPVAQLLPYLFGGIEFA